MIKIDNLSYSYNLSEEKALKDISLEAKNGEITVCTGPSGCGKSTLLRVINSLCPNYYGGCLDGEILIDGESVRDREIAYVSSKVGSLFQEPERQFFALNVEDEIAFALQWQGIDEEEIKSRVEDVIKRFSLDDVREQSITSLSEGQKQKVGLASIIAMQVRNIILDEPTANLDPEATEELARILDSLKQQGYCIFVVDHRLYYLKDYADRVIVMQHGAIVHEGDYSSLNDSYLCQKYGLRQYNIIDRRELLPSHNPQKSAIEIDNLCFSYKSGKRIFENLNLKIGPGCHVLIGKNGVGKTTLSRLIFNLEKKQQGRVLFDGECLKHPLLKGSLVLQNTDYQLNMTTVYKELKSCFELSGQKDCHHKITKLLSELDLSAFSERHPQSLSGGQKQRLVIGCALAKNPLLMILDEPTSGLDGDNMRRIKSILEDYASDGHCVVIITHDLELLDSGSFDAIRLNSKE
ncbi:ABC transporter ATP-binding protein [Succinivibrio dextrinosolvens]|uniref:ABC transporter ATP-binding protein n=1 Tax=Succinivibrio dextrinosolvens TaxID=83771 RepID=UPI0004E13B62|nr:ABC transporter ATP-binding protein [Succinivibrio dextrinosolvens]